MKKKIIAFLLVLSMLFTLLMSFASCDKFTDKKDDDDDKTEEIEDTEEEINDTEEEINDGSIKASKELREVLPKAQRVIDIKPLIPGLSDLVLDAYEETNGRGYIFRIATDGYKSGMEVLVGIDADGKITGSKCIATNDTFGKEPELDNTYNGQTISDYEAVMITGATMTSRGYAEAVLVALQSYTLASGEKLDPAIIIEELLPELAPGFGRATEIEAPEKVKKAFKAYNDACFAYIFSNDQIVLLALVNASGHCTIYDINGNDVTSDYANIATDAIAFASKNQTSYFNQLEKKIQKLYSDASGIKEISITTFNSIVCAAEFTSGGSKLYAYYSRIIGFDQMDIYIILDSKNAIAKMDAEKFIFEEEYFMAFGGMNTSDYKAGFNGLTESSFTSDTSIIAGATMSSNAVEQAVRDAFDTAKKLK